MLGIDGKIPAYVSIGVFRTSSKANCAAQPSNLQPNASDHEDYLARHRWGFLVSHMLDGEFDVNGCFKTCIGWIDANADTAAAAWEPYSASERIANFLVFFAALPAESRVKSIPSKIQEFLSASVNWVYEHLEYYGPTETNNHILNNARALVLGGVVCGSRHAISAGMEIYRQCLPKMVTEGGFLRERSSHYQLIVLNWILDAWHFIADSASPNSEDAAFLAGYAGRMRNAAAIVCGPEALLGLIGDVSPDLTPEQSWDRLALLYPEWWPGQHYSVPGPTLIDGWFRLSKGRDVVLGNFPNGRFPPKFPTHGHSDFTGLLWVHGGEDILVDLGRYRYTCDAVSLAQAGATGHNLPTVNDLAPLWDGVMQGSCWRPIPYADAQLKSAPATDGVVLEHDGFSRATAVKLHKRRIELENQGLRIVDTFEGSEMVDLSFFWHFAESFANFDVSLMLARGRHGDVRIDVADLGGGSRLDAVAFATCISNAYGHFLPGIGVRLSGRVKLPATIVTTLSYLAGTE